MAKRCYWCHELLPPLPEDASYIDEINPRATTLVWTGLTLNDAFMMPGGVIS